MATAGDAPGRASHSADALSWASSNVTVPLAAEQLAEVVGHNNTMGICCFGEQGMNNSRKAIHGNLMFGCLLFSNKMREVKGPQQSGAPHAASLDA